MHKKEARKIIFSKLWGLLFFLVLIILLNMAAVYVKDFAFQAIVDFLNQNLMIIVGISVVLSLGNIFETFIFPFSIFYPIFNAIGGILWVKFAYQLLYLVDIITSQSISQIFLALYPVAIILVPALALLIGYVHIISKLMSKEEELFRREKKRRAHIDWFDVGQEFKLASYNLGKTLKNALDPKKGKK